MGNRRISIGKAPSGNLAIFAINSSGIKECLTEDLERVPNDRAYIDVRRVPWFRDFIRNNNLGFIHSAKGPCNTLVLYEFCMENLMACCS